MKTKPVEPLVKLSGKICKGLDNGSMGVTIDQYIYSSVEKFSVKTIDVAGYQAASKALRLPFGNKNKPTEGSPFYEILEEPFASMYAADVKLISTLVKRGDEHAKVLRGVVVWCEINAPRYWWQEMDRYSVGACCLSSESTMHIQGKGLDEDALVEMKENLLEGTMQKRVWMFSYQTLRRIYKQRHNHRLPQWRMFCDWIKALPYAEEFIICDGNGNTDK